MIGAVPQVRVMAGDARPDQLPTNPGPTCLKWGSDGELTSLDLGLVLDRLARVDQRMADAWQRRLDGQTVPPVG
jgi:hypothetical protein